MNDDFDALFDPTPIVTEEFVEAPVSEPHAEVVADAVTEEFVPQKIPHEANASNEELVDDRDEEEKLEDKVPLATFLNVKNSLRDKLKAAEQNAAEYQRQLDDFRKSQQPVAYVPDPNNDPVAWAQHQFSQVEQQMLDQKIQICGTHAVEKHGGEVVGQAASWGEARAAADPAFDQAFRAQPDPVAWLISQHKHAVQLDEMQRDPESFARRIALEKGWLAASADPVASASVPATQTNATKVRPTSLTDIPAATGKMTVQSEQDDFDALFKR